ncbi:MAG: DUF3842 family protein [Oscillospiraceae bacterium]|nr:DUF3842 family protein [Oscillospiraceae bacterium]
MKIVIIDGQGGKLGAKLTESVRAAVPEAEITAVGTNTTATERMLKAGAEKAATGENAVKVACRTADVIMGPIGIVIADALMGEITPKMAQYVGESEAQRVLVPMNLCDTYVAGTVRSSAEIVQDAVRYVCALAERIKNE